MKESETAEEMLVAVTDCVNVDMDTAKSVVGGLVESEAWGKSGWSK